MLVLFLYFFFRCARFKLLKMFNIIKDQQSRSIGFVQRKKATSVDFTPHLKPSKQMLGVGCDSEYDLYLLIYTRKCCKDNLTKVGVRQICKNELTCIREGGEGVSSATRQIKCMKALMRYDLLNQLLNKASSSWSL